MLRARRFDAGDHQDVAGMQEFQHRTERLAALGRGAATERRGVPNVCDGRLINIGTIIMGSTADKASGLANEAIGKAKQGVGNVVGSDKLKTEGAGWFYLSTVAALRALDSDAEDEGTKLRAMRRGISSSHGAAMVATTAPSFSLVERNGVWF
jgi:hypothetical protein